MRYGASGGGMATEILIIRHGETAANAARVVQTPDVPLSPRGREQAERLAHRLAGLGIERILSSDLERARETAETVGRRTGAPLLLDALLQERNYGQLRGTAYADLGDVDIFAHGFAPPAGETGAAFDARVDAAWTSIQRHAAAVAGRLAVVTHGLVCASLASRHWVGVEALPAAWANTSVTFVEGRPPWRVIRLACAQHLGVAEPEAGAV